MTTKLTEKYPHLQFQKIWRETSEISYLLGQINGIIDIICRTPILPEKYQDLLKVALIKGAQATTAIEGNTLTESEIEKVKEGYSLPPSKEYQAIEVKNILDAYNELLQRVIYNNEIEIISPSLIKEFHMKIGKDLGVHLDAIPGKFRNDNRQVGRYRCPDYEDVPALIDSFCHWLKKEFHFFQGQHFSEYVIQAIISHVYIEWIHPFGDGNGRTGRLIEFFILIRGGLPDIASHILSNHYNLTRSEYYRQLEVATKKRDLTEFIQYALLGFRDGLGQTLNIIQESLLILTWHKFIHDKLKDQKNTNLKVYRRKRDLLIDLPLGNKFTFDKIMYVSTRVAVAYNSITKRSIERDLNQLIQLGLLKYEDRLYSANIDVLQGYFTTRRKGIVP